MSKLSEFRSAIVQHILHFNHQQQPSLKQGGRTLADKNWAIIGPSDIFKHFLIWWADIQVVDRIETSKYFRDGLNRVLRQFSTI